MRKTTIKLREEDDARIDELKATIPTTETIQAIRFALHNCPLPRRKR